MTIKRKIETFIMYFFPRFWSITMIKYFLKRNEEDRNMMISFLEKSPEGILKQTKFRVYVGLGKENYNQHLFAEKISPTMNYICNSMKEKNISKIRNTLLKLTRDKLEFIAFSLTLAYDAYFQLISLKRIHEKYKKLMMSIPEDQRDKSYLIDSGNQKKEIEECALMIKNCNLNGLTP